jgi:Fe-S cluster assembly protein SufD
MLVGTHAHVDHYTLQTQTGQTQRGNAYQVNSIHCYQANDSIVNNYTFSWDGLLIRNNLYTQLQGAHAQANMYGMYCPSQTQHIDNHTTVNHQHPNTESNQLYKGILLGKATGVFNGKIFVQPEAQKTNAFQANNNILLSDEATIYTKPQLEIWADDVKCSHGATVGQLDETQVFYLRARGIPEALARHMLLQAFADEVIGKVPLLTLRKYLEESFKVHIDQLA